MVKPPEYPGNFRYVMYLVTYQCNYRCHYCYWSGNLSRKAYLFKTGPPRLPKNIIQRLYFPLLQKAGVFQKAHAFDNYPLKDWLDLFEKIFEGKKAYLHLSGGEPMLYFRDITQIMERTAKVAEDCWFRFDTNGSITPDFPEKLKPRIGYNVSYHKDTIPDLDRFIASLKALSKQGNVIMVNRVVASEDELTVAVDEMRKLAKLGYFMNITPAFRDVSKWKKENVKLFKKTIHPADFELQYMGKTKGEPCIYPTFGFMLTPNGHGYVQPCNVNRAVNLMGSKDKWTPEDILYKHSIACPVPYCNCIGQYSFTRPLQERNTKSYDILKNFADSQMEYRRNNSILD
jgi:organic radical activating enzyme